MSEHDDQTEEHELYEEVPPRSIFAATWFRVLLVVIVIGVIGAVAIPYVLDFMNPPPSKPATAKAPAPAAPIPATPAADKDKKDTPAPPPTASAPVETKPVTPPPAAAKAPEPPKTAAAPLAGKGKSAMAVTESKQPAPAAKPDTTAKPAAKPDATAKADTAKPDTSAKTDTVAKADTARPAAKDTAKPAAAAKPAAEPKRAAATATTSRPASGSGPFWVQVGAFRDADTAKRLAEKLRAENFKVEESVTRTGGSTSAAKSAPKPAPAAAPKPHDITADQYDVFVTGQTPEELNKRLSAKGLAAEQSGSGMVVKPSLPLRDAVALSKDLAVEGFKVQVRRSGGSMASASPAPAPSAQAAPAASGASEGGSELHRVRVGSFPDRASAQDAVKQLEAKGYKPYIARGDQ